MSFYSATLGELIIIEAFVFFIWLQVLISSAKANDHSLSARKVLITSVGLVLTAAAIIAIMFVRALEIRFDGTYTGVIVGCYIVLAVGNIMFMVSASIGNSLRQFKLFLIATAIWSAVALFYWLR